MKNSSSQSTDQANLDHTKNNKNHIGNLIKNNGMGKAMLLLTLPIMIIFVAEAVTAFIDASLIFRLVPESGGADRATLSVMKGITTSYFK